MFQSQNTRGQRAKASSSHSYKSASSSPYFSRESFRSQLKDYTIVLQRNHAGQNGQISSPRPQVIGDGHARHAAEHPHENVGADRRPAPADPGVVHQKLVADRPYDVEKSADSDIFQDASGEVADAEDQRNVNQRIGYDADAADQVEFD